MKAWIAWVALVLALAWNGGASAFAQDDDESSGDESRESTDTEGTGEEGGDAPTADASGEGGAKDDASAMRAWSFGPYFRFNVVPAFMLELMLDIAPTPTGPAFGGLASY